ncbi:DNA-directed RNA polymerase subunit beta [Pseudoglutamicibacter albus]|uniref:DNA-directed RNA polymerase subunit beta n=1 Tax=Pseudoglutamicibacter cumminsii TaxID=156979 RepID=A0ABX5L701_9MICC|nr:MULTISPECIES: DNA-directed RNA polymerase subunit beta [Pseudoglutamicibacter]MDK7083060.1 DNA-directed RNA polymerase subunit beta [Pseudoglutamicibacter cumminsii]MDZ3745143.1 DNA-directed RNA polymerase subunit beta [Pseudoglutamicibacter cumminsii]PKY79596.1 DNA-directed RNA polymerase subunit beta [Pseudoglutamicibacter albus]PWI28348.1 DNA-directed RNA polymerase subunit beta [Pseudoglutamicibacter cumminsii]WIK83868.1 DNA-directed RNA polymerase subunit beta [Pseudoglutamicibacter al
MVASSTSQNSTATSARTAAAAGRISFAKIHEPLDVPDLLALQTESFDWLIGNERWQQRVAKAEETGDTSVPRVPGLAEIFEEISPIEDFQGTMSLSFSEPEFADPKYTIAEAKDRDATYSAPLYVRAEFMNNQTGEIKQQTVFMGDFPLMTDNATFIINGTERVVVSQLVRSPGAYFERTPDKTSDKDIYSARVIPSRGAWFELEVDKRDQVSVRLDRKRKQSVTVLLKALGWTESQILSEFGDYESIRLTLEKDTVHTEEEALLDIYRKLRPGEPPTVEAARNLLENLYFTPKRYDLAKVGRYKLNHKLGMELPMGTPESYVLTEADIVAMIRYIVALHAGERTIKGVRKGEETDISINVDDIDHFGNRRIRAVGELIENQVRTGLSRMERVVRERMTTQDVEAITPQTLINIRPVVAAIKEFFGTSQLSQFMDQNNPLAGVTHKRRLSALGPGGLSRDRAGMEVRDVHPSHYGRMCPIETPEGPNIGLIGSLATYGRINSFGFIETPYRRVVDGVVTEHVDYLTADEELEHQIAQANAPLAEDGTFEEDLVLCRERGGGGEPVLVAPNEIDYMDVSPRQMVSAATALIPFLEHDDANRALMGANMQRQAVPLLEPDSPIVGTGMEKYLAVDSGDAVLARKPGVVTSVSADLVSVMNDDGTQTNYPIMKFARSNQGNGYNQKVVVSEGDRLEAQALIADGPATQAGELALGKNLLVAFMSWEGLNYEDAIILSERMVSDDVLTSIHIEEYEVDARDTKLGAEEITRDIPNVSEEVLSQLDERGIIHIGAEVEAGDVLVGRVTPKGETELTPEERLLRAIFGEKSREVRDTSLRIPHGESGTVIGVRIFDRDEDDELPPGVNQLVRVYVAQKRKITVGDKLAGRHGNKGVISKILPVEDMPFMADGTPVDVILNPLGVPGRMNLGQVMELHLGWAASQGWKIEGEPEWIKNLPNLPREQGPVKVATPVFDGAEEEEVRGLLDYTLPSRDGEQLIGNSGKATLFDGRSGQPFPEPISVGYMYILKLHHLVDDKIHARSTGPYSMITQQPLGGKAQFGGQRFGEMEVWALEAYGAAYTLQELLTVKSDDIHGRVKVYEAIVKGDNIPAPGVPESFKVLLKEMQSLCLNVEVLSTEGETIEMRDADEEVFRAAEELGINLSNVEPSSVDEV